jgi:hypothetical protein
MKEIYIQLIEKFLHLDTIAAFNLAGVPPVKYVDIYRGQYLDYEKVDVVPLPAILFEWSASITDKNLNDSMLIIKLHLVYEQVLDTSSLSSSQNDALKFFDFLSLVHSAVSTIQVEGSGKLKMRTQEQVELDRPGIVHLLTYETSFSGFEVDVASTFDWTEEDDIDFTEDGQLIQKFKKEEVPFYPSPSIFD